MLQALRAISTSLNEISSDEYSIKIVSSGVGGISESDVNLAIATESIILGFNVRADNTAKKVNRVREYFSKLSQHHPMN